MTARDHAMQPTLPFLFKFCRRSCGQLDFTLFGDVGKVTDRNVGIKGEYF